MIDTDKYEGHTEGPWVCTHSPVNGGGQFWSVVDHTQPTDVGDDTLGNWRIADIIDFEADAQLIADAPLLLAEVKRLQERLDWILGDEELASYVWEKEVAYMEWEGVRLPWISADEWGEDE